MFVGFMSLLVKLARGRFHGIPFHVIHLILYVDVRIGLDSKISGITIKQSSNASNRVIPIIIARSSLTAKGIYNRFFRRLHSTVISFKKARFI